MSKETETTAKVELLSPAGDRDCFIAAVNAGCDAVYLALERFGARAGARNFTKEELNNCLDIAHINGRKIYLTVNTLFKDSETEELYDLLKEAYINGLDAVIVQDIGVMSLIGAMFPDLPIHVSTQAAITAGEGISFLKDLGIKRVVPARELSLPEIKTMKKNTGISLECFIHGSLCYSYSGKCLLSSFIGARSGNRGRCAQPCRLPYDNAYPLSLKDLCVIEHLPELIEAGIDSFKIEGRMKNSDYVYGVTSIYRKYIDKYYGNEDYKVDPNDVKKLISLYTRSGNCNGYYRKHNGREMITRQSPSYSTSVPDKDSTSYTTAPSVSVNALVVIKEGQPVTISVSDVSDSINVVTDTVPEKALKQSISKADVEKQIRKTGGTSVVFSDVDIDLDEGLFIRNSKLNEIRRQGIEAFLHRRLLPYRRTCQCDFESIRSQERDIYELTYEPADHPKINVSVLDMDQLKAALSSKADGIIIPMSLYLSYLQGSGMSFNGKDLYIHLPYVIREEGMTNSSFHVAALIDEAVKGGNVRGFYASNLESVKILTDYTYKGEIIGDIHLYAYNRSAYRYYREHGITKTTVPVELNEHDIISRGIKGEELTVYGRLPMMISANCVYNTQTGCDKKGSGHELYLTDRKGEKLYVKCCCNECTNVIYNSVPLSISDEDKLIGSIRPSSLRFCFTDESPEKIRNILELYFSQRRPGGSAGTKLCEKYTRGHLKRGML